MKQRSEMGVSKSELDSNEDTSDCSSPHVKPNGKVFLETLLNKTLKVEISDGRTLIGQYLCTDRDKNIILGSCQEFISDPDTSLEEPRILGLAMVPGRHVKSLHVDIDREFHSTLVSILQKDENREVER